MTKKLLLLNGLAILVVPLHHATAYGLNAMTEWAHRYMIVTGTNLDQLSSLKYYLTMAIRQLDSFAVPAFLFISGYFIAFMARGEKSKVTWKMVLPRVKILVIPLLLWTIIRNMLLLRVPNSLDDLLNPYTFILLLIQFYLVSPFIVPLAKNRGKLLLLAAAVIHLGVQTLKYLYFIGLDFPGMDILIWLTPRWFFLAQQPFWFPLGVVIGLHLTEVNKLLMPLKRLLLVSTIVLGVVSVFEYLYIDQILGDTGSNPALAGFTRTLYILALILWYLTLNEDKIPFSKQISKLSGRSLGIYLANIPVSYVVAVFFYHYIPALLGMQLLYQGFLFLVGLFGPLLLMELLRRSPARRYYRLVFG